MRAALVDIDDVHFPIDCSALPGRTELIRKTCKRFDAKVKVRERTSDNGYLMLIGTITVSRPSYVASRAGMHALLDELALLGLDRATLSGRF